MAKRADKKTPNDKTSQQMYSILLKNITPSHKNIEPFRNPTSARISRLWTFTGAIYLVRALTVATPSVQHAGRASPPAGWNGAYNRPKGKADGCPHTTPLHVGKPDPTCKPPCHNEIGLRRAG